MHLWAESAERNEKNEISGVLLCGEDLLFQILEGPEASVEALYAKIREDRRHREVEQVHCNYPATRLFRGIPMKLVDARRAEHLRRRYTREALTGASHKQAAELAFSLARF